MYLCFQWLTVYFLRFRGGIKEVARVVSGDASALRVVYGAGIAARATLPPMLTRPAPPATLCEPGRLHDRDTVFED